MKVILEREKKSKYGIFKRVPASFTVFYNLFSIYEEIAVF